MFCIIGKDRSIPFSADPDPKQQHLLSYFSFLLPQKLVAYFATKCHPGLVSSSLSLFHYLNMEKPFQDSDFIIHH